MRAIKGCNHPQAQDSITVRRKRMDFNDSYLANLGPYQY